MHVIPQFAHPFAESENALNTLAAFALQEQSLYFIIIIIIVQMLV